MRYWGNGAIERIIIGYGFLFNATAVNDENSQYQPEQR